MSSPAEGQGDMDCEDNMGLGPEASSSGIWHGPRGGGPEDGGPVGGPPGKGIPGGPPRGGPPGGEPGAGRPGKTPGGEPPAGPPGADTPESIWRWIVYLKGEFGIEERDLQINKTETKAQKELNIAKREARELIAVVTELLKRLDRLEILGSGRSSRRPVELGPSDGGWRPGPGPGRPRAPSGAR